METKRVQKLGRQGDILFKSINAKNLPAKTKRKDDNVLAYGEVTGHAHKIFSPSMDQLESVVDEKGDIYVLSKDEDITVNHDEHGSLVLEKGKWWCITRQREYDPLAAEKQRKVAD